MTAQEQKVSDFYSNARDAARGFRDNLNAFLALQTQFTYGDYGPEGENPLPDGAADSSNEGVTAAQISAAIFDTANAIKALLDGGHGANLEALY